MQADRRRINAPVGGTAPPIFNFTGDGTDAIKRPRRTRQPDEHRKIFLRTGVVPSASGSAYYEIPPQEPGSSNETLVPNASSLKITCTVHGPRPLPRSAAFSPNLLLSTHIKFAPFATRQRRGWVRDASERDLGVHLETALRGAIIGERWPKSACEVVVTVLEGEEDGWWGERQERAKRSGWGMMSVLAGCITVASAALVDAGIDCLDLVSGGVAGLVSGSSAGVGAGEIVIDPAPVEQKVVAACLVGYLHSRDEITEMWVKGDAGIRTEALLDQAVKAATMTRTVLVESIKEAVEFKAGNTLRAANGALKASKGKGKDVIMTG